MTKTLIGLVLAFLIGAICRVVEIPVPAPTALMGAFLVMSMTLGFLAMDWFENRQAVKAED